MYEVRNNFLKAIENHQLIVLLDQGLYKHLRFKNPKSNDYWFDITTWNDYLCISGDMGCYTFSRVEDMFKFFRNRKYELNVNPVYWGEKIQAGCEARKVIKAWSQERFIKNVREYVSDRLYPLSLSEAKEVVKDIQDSIFNCTDEWESVEAIRNFDNDSIDFCDFFEYDCEDYTYHYLWCCHAIVWAIQQYDNFKSEAPDA